MAHSKPAPVAPIAAASAPVHDVNDLVQLLTLKDQELTILRQQNEGLRYQVAALQASSSASADSSVLQRERDEYAAEVLRLRMQVNQLQIHLQAVQHTPASPSAPPGFGP